MKLFRPLRGVSVALLLLASSSVVVAGAGCSSSDSPSPPVRDAGSDSGEGGAPSHDGGANDSGSTLDANDAALPGDAASDGAGSDATAADSGDAGAATDGPTDGNTDNDAGGDAGGEGGVLPRIVHFVAGVQVSTLAGSSVAGTQDGMGGAAQFNNPTGVAIDASGNLVVADYNSSLVRLVTSAGGVTTIGGGSGFVYPFATAVASDGTYYVQTDANNAGVKNATSGTIWSVTPLADGGVATPVMVAEGFGRPRGVAPAAGGNLFLSDRTQEIVASLAVVTGQPTFLAGSAGAAGYVNATGSAAYFSAPVGAAAMPDGSFVVADSGNNRIRRVTTGGVVTTFAGDGSPTLVDGTCVASSFNAPRAVAVDAAGDVFVSDNGDSVIRRITAACVVETVAGSGTAGFSDGAGSGAEFYGEEGLAVSTDGHTLYVADGNSGDGSAYNRIRVITIP